MARHLAHRLCHLALQKLLALMELAPLQLALHEAITAGIPIDTADALVGRPFGIPKTGVFGLYDLIGIDLMSDVAASLRSILPADDAFHAVGDDPALNQAMIAAGYTGNKGKGGFYRIKKLEREKHKFIMKKLIQL